MRKRDEVPLERQRKEPRGDGTVSGNVSAAEASEDRACVKSSQQAGVTGRIPIRSYYPRFFEEEDLNGRLVSCLHDVDGNLGPEIRADDGSWMVDTKDGHYHRGAEELYGIQYAQGYWCELPHQPNARVTRSPLGFIAFYTHHLDYGLRFPLDPFVTRVLQEYNISLA